MPRRHGGRVDHHGVTQLLFGDEIVENQKDLSGPFLIVFTVALDPVFIDRPRRRPLLGIAHIETPPFAQGLGEPVEGFVDDEGEELVDLLLLRLHQQLGIQELIPFGDGALGPHLLLQQFQILLKLRVVFQRLQIDRLVVVVLSIHCIPSSSFRFVLQSNTP